MTNELETLWQDFKAHCENVFSNDGTFLGNTAKLYLDSCLPVSYADGVLVLDVPNPFIKEQINSRFLPRMKDLFSDIGFGSEIVVEVTETSDDDKTKERAEEIAKQKKPIITSRNGLNPNYIFPSFVVGPSNRMAHSACLSVAESPGVAYNPLFIWGKVGLGKTHLMHAIGHHIENTLPGIKILYVSAEKFTNDFISAIRNNTNNEFRSRYRELDVLMIDDIQFIGDKESTQEELFHTFNTLHNAKKQVIISSDRPPKEIQGVTERLVSRFQWGLVTDIQLPDFETRVAILQKKAEIKKYRISDDIIVFIAQNIPSNIRELEGTLNRIVACAEFNDDPMTVENVSVWLKDLIRDNMAGPISIGLIQQLVAESFGISMEDLLSQKRTADLALARQVAMYMARNKTGESLQQIGYAFNKKDHTTVIHACKKVEDLIKTDLRVRSFVDNIASKL
ncbi:chromosomal replication initiator protein DnaA [Synergistaceae bacterium OttesenSCG-928-D05]|nr:chromosomal replication initiator protein DnaA [Synergistaceae bacterium OttesenSCG-928-D05]